MTAIPLEKCNNQVILMGKITGVVLANVQETAYSWINTGGNVFQLEFNRNLDVPECLEDCNIRVIGELSSGYKGDVIVKVTDYTLTTHYGSLRKKQPRGWKAEWPIRKRVE